jgi:hypothetical protein
MTATIPAGTLSSDGDEVEVNVPGIYRMYTGSTNIAYSWQLYVNAGDSQGIQQDVSPLTFISSDFAVDWNFRFKRLTSTTFILSGAHRLGGDDGSDRTNIVGVLRASADDLGTTPDFDSGDIELSLSVTLALANPAHHMRTFGYTVWKVGGGSEAGSGGDPALLVTATTIFTNDNRVLRSNGTNRVAQASTVTIDDSGNIDTPGIISLGSNSVSRGAVNFHSETSGLTNKSVQIASIPWSTEAGVQFRPLIPGSELAIDLMPNGTANKVHIDLVNNGDLNSDTNNWEVLAISMFTDRGVISTGQRGTGSFRPLYLSDADITGQRRVHVMNASSGSGSWATFSVLNEDSEDAGLRLMAMGRSFGSSGAFRQDAGVLEAGSDLSGGMSISARHASGGEIRFYTGGFADGSNRMTIAATGDITINKGLVVSNSLKLPYATASRTAVIDANNQLTNSPFTIGEVMGWADPATKPVFFTEFLSKAGLATGAGDPLGVAAILTGTVAGANYETNRPGVVRLSSAVTLGSGYNYFDSLFGVRPFGGEYGYAGIKFVNTNATVGYYGLHDTQVTNEPVDGIYFMQFNGYLSGVNSSNSVRSFTTTSNLITTNVWYRLERSLNMAGTISTFKLIEPQAPTTVWTDTATNNVPLGSRTMGYNWIMLSTSGTAIPLGDLDYIAEYQAPGVRR